MTSTPFTNSTFDAEILRFKPIKLAYFEPEAKLYASDRCTHVGGKMSPEQVWRWPMRKTSNFAETAVQKFKPLPFAPVRTLNIGSCHV